MAKRGDPVKQITVSEDIFKRFISYKEYNENKEGILIKLMDATDKLKAFTNHHKKK